MRADVRAGPARRDARNPGSRFVQPGRPVSYIALLEASWTPEALRDGLAYGVCLEQLARAYLVAEQRPVASPLFAAEQRALEQLDVPLFVGSSDSRDLVLDDGTTVIGAFSDPSDDEAYRQAEALSEVDLREQVSLIRASLLARSAHRLGGAARGAATPIEPELSDDELMRAAERIGQRISEEAIRRGDVNAGWIAMRYLHEQGRYQIGTLGDSLYDGACGIALFLAALSRIGGERSYAALAVQALGGLRRRIREVGPEYEPFAGRAHGIGGATGIGSWIYGLVQRAQLLDGGESLVDDAASLSGWLAPSVIAADERLDVVDGAAGAALALLALHSVTGEPRRPRGGRRCAGTGS